MTRNHFATALLCACLMVAGCGMPTGDPGAGSEPAPDFEFQSIDGSKSFRLSSLKGKVVVLEFWAAWCSDCIRAMPKQRELTKAFEGQDVVFLGLVHPRGGVEKVQETVKKYGLKSLQMFDEEKGETKERLAGKYQVEWIPTVVFIDKQGRLRGRQKSIEGMKFLDAKVVIKKLLEE